MPKKSKYDRRRKYYMVLDCETATLPYARKFAPDSAARKNVAIAKPLIYDIGWKMIDKRGKVYARKNYLVSEIFSVPEIFNTGYYSFKRPLYLEKMKRGEITLTDWRSAAAELLDDMRYCFAVGAYNSMFDFKKAIPFTELYINQLYSANFYDWLKIQERICDRIAQGDKMQNEREFEREVFRFHGEAFPLFDIWGLACRHILNCDDYKKMCLRENWQTPSGLYFKTSAETCYRFYSGAIDFDEAHTAIDDSDIEAEIMTEIIRRTGDKWEMGIIYFPFRILGKVENFQVKKFMEKG